MSKQLSIAYQLYSVREEMANDMEATLAQLVHMGYQGVEFAGFFERSAKDIRKLMKKTGLTPIGSHVPLTQIQADAEEVLWFHEDIECPYIVIPSLSENDRPGAAGFANALRSLYTFGKQCKKRGITLLYHNHDFELNPFSGLTGLDFILTAIPAKQLQAELDTCWLKFAGFEPATSIRKYANRCPLLHLHDFKQPADAPILFKPVGFGCQDVPAIIVAAEEAHTKWLVVEQDESPERPALDAAKMSIDYLKGLRK